MLMLSQEQQQIRETVARLCARFDDDYWLEKDEKGYHLARPRRMVTNPAHHDAKVAGIVAYYPLYYDGVDPSVPVLVMIGEKDDWTPAARCQAVAGKSNFEIFVYPGITHAFRVPFPKPVDVLGRHLVYDEKATQDEQQRADAFMAAQMKQYQGARETIITRHAGASRFYITSSASRPPLR